MEAGLHRRALNLSYFTVGYNILEGIVSVGAGLLAGSVALVGFGLDSFVESLSGGVMIWRWRRGRQLTAQAEEHIETQAVRLIAYTFFILAAYVGYESIIKLYQREAPDTSLPGMLITIISLIVMPILFYLKRDTAQLLDSRSLAADAKQTLGCVLLSFAVLIGLILNHVFGLWWVDPVIGLGIVGFFIKEGYGALKHRTVCAC
jgi:divalent metal cation (Fe/Co/Zn/Cd) transporter